MIKINPSDESEAYKILRSAFKRNDAIALAKYGMLGPEEVLGSLDQYLHNLMIRIGYLKAADCWDARRIDGTAMDNDEAHVLSGILSSMGNSQKKFLEARGNALEYTGESDLKALEDFCGVHNLSETGIAMGSSKAVTNLIAFSYKLRTSKPSRYA